MATRKTTASSAEPAFEQDLERLEQLVADMEKGDLPLDELMKRFEEGMGLVHRCSGKLADVERKVEILLQQSAEGEPKTKPFEPEG